jgi:hypothetical protein
LGRNALYGEQNDEQSAAIPTNVVKQALNLYAARGRWYGPLYLNGIDYIANAENREIDADHGTIMDEGFDEGFIFKNHRVNSTVQKHIQFFLRSTLVSDTR